MNLEMTVGGVGSLSSSPNVPFNFSKKPGLEAAWAVDESKKMLA
jgi:hypothetical protein